MAKLKNKLGKRIKELRKQKGYTQEKFAEKIGMATSSFGYLETGKFYPAPENIEKIAKALGVQVHDLFNFKDINNKDELLKEINEGIDFIKDNNEKLLTLYLFINQLI